MSGDKTFRHIDVNIDRCVKEGHRKNMIQDSVLFDDEDNENCTIIILGMHRRLEEWNARMRACGYRGTGMVERIQKHMWAAEDLWSCKSAFDIRGYLIITDLY